MSILINVNGKPEPAGSKRAFVPKGWKRPVVVDANTKSKGWKNAVADAAAKTYRGELLDGPLAVEFCFIVVRPKSHFGSGKNASKLKASAPLFPATRPDVLKLARGAEDALTGIVWKDDAQICYEGLRKIYGEKYSTSIFVVELTEENAWVYDMGEYRE